MIAACGEQRLHEIVSRHVQAEPVYGIPDLFLYAVTPRNEIGVVRFDEVKRPGEVVSTVQKEEIGFLRHHGFRAGVVRLIEH